MSEADDRECQTRETAKQDRAERIRELVRSDFRALKDTAEYCAITIDQMKSMIDAGEPTASLIVAICEHYHVSEQFVLHGSDLFDADALGMALDVVMSSVFLTTFPKERGLAINPYPNHGLISKAASQYSEAVARHVAGCVQVHYERFVRAVRTANLSEAENISTGEYLDPWAETGAEAPKPDNVHRLMRRDANTKSDGRL